MTASRDAVRHALVYELRARGAAAVAPPASEPRHTISDGRSFPQWRVALPASAADDAAAVPAPNVNVFQTEAQADALAALLQERGLSAASIGCGNGYLEGMLEAREIDVLAVELELTLTRPSIEDAILLHADCARSARRARPAARRPRRDGAPLCMGADAAVAELPRGVPAVPLVVIVGDLSRDGCATEPAADARRRRRLA